MDTVILSGCHFLNDEIISEFKNLRNSCEKYYDVVLLYDNTKNDFKNFNGIKFHKFNLNNVYKHGYKKLSERTHKKRTQIMRHTGILSILDFFNINRCYQYYWLIEYDVRLTGSWEKFFNSFQRNNSDLLTAFLGCYQDLPEWTMWNKVGMEVNNKDQIRGIFFPVLRISNRALDSLDEYYKSEQQIGYCEVFVPTLLNIKGLTMQDIGKKWYDMETFQYNKHADNLIIEKNKLIHPIK